ncbi:hypothetical protein [Phenylobacterium sp.]|jgi:hypothetical protein|uniref:hypothetical protein n=1 Tax=Phenylobacterium sp. TaxID=1871053 RepID=UPI0037838707
MRHARRPQPPQTGAEIIDFDEALLAACPPEMRAELMAEAAMLAGAFAPDGRANRIEAMARALQSGNRDQEMSRARARRLAAALRALSRGAGA